MTSSVLSFEEEAQVKEAGFYFQELSATDGITTNVIADHLADEIILFEKEGMEKLVGMLGETWDEESKGEDIARDVEILSSYLDILEVAILQDLPDATTLLSLVERRIQEGQALSQERLLREEKEEEDLED